MTHTQMLAVLAGALTPSTLAAVLADLEESRQRTRDLQVLQDEATRAFAEQLASLEGDDAAERMRPEFRNSPAGRMKVQFV